MIETPYVGLVPYSAEDADFFFGRDDEKRVVTGNLRASRLTILYGPSGVGKTSLLQAGVVHDLREQTLENAAKRLERAPFAISVFQGWQDDPLPALAETIRLSAVEALGGEQLPEWQPGESLVHALRAWTERVRTLLVVLDQFEDYLRYHPDEDGDGTFATEFPRIVNDANLRVDFLVSIREDAWAKLDRFEGRIPRLFANYVRVEHLSRRAAREAIEGPISEWNRGLPAGEEPYAIEPALVEAVIDAAAASELSVGEAADVAIPEATSADAIEAPFLQLVMGRLWRATVEAGSRELTLARLEELGGAQSIVENHLLEALGGLTRDERAVAADVFRFLATRSKTKVTQSASDLAEWTKRPEHEVSVVLDKLCRAESGRILRPIPPPPGENQATRYELFHDVLAEPILDWRRGRERRATLGRRARIGAVVFALFAGVLFAGLTVWALDQRSAAERATARALREKDTASLLAVASTAAGAQLDTRVDNALLLGLTAYESGESVAARSALLSGLEIARSSGLESILHGHTNAVLAVAFSSDGRTVASAGFDRTVRLWDIRTHRPLGELRGHTGTTNSVAFSPDGRTLASASHDRTVRLWDLRTRRLRGRLRGHSDDILSVAFSPDGRTLASAGDDRTVRLWSVRSLQLLATLRSSRPVLSVAYNPDGRTLASAGSDGAVRVWNVRTHKTVAILPVNVRFVLSVAFSPDGRTLAATGGGGMLRLWDTRTHKRLGRPLRGHAGFVNSVAFSPDSRMLASAGDDLTVRLWNVRTHERIGESRRGHSGFVKSVAFGPEGRTVVSGSQDGTARVWKVPADGAVPALPGRRVQVSEVAFSPDGRTIAAAAGHAVQLWNVRTRRPSGVLSVGADDVFTVAFGPDGSTLAVPGSNRTVRLWNVRTHQPLGQLLSRRIDGVSSVAFSPDGGTVAAASIYAVQLWNVSTRRPSGVLGHRKYVRSVAFSPDGHTLASAGNDRTVRLWDVETAQPLGQRLSGHTHFVTSVAFSPDGRTLASGSVDSTARLWNAQTHRPVAILRGHIGDVSGVVFSPDGLTLASAGDDGTVRLWDVETGQPLGEPLRGLARRVYGVAFSPDGLTLAWPGSDGRVRLWQGVLWRNTAVLQRRVCRLVIGNLTRAEWDALAPGVVYRTICPS